MNFEERTISSPNQTVHNILILRNQYATVLVQTNEINDNMIYGQLAPPSASPFPHMIDCINNRMITIDE